MMKALSERGARDPRIHALVGRVLWDDGVKGKDQRGEISSLFHFVIDNVAYRRDPQGIELFQGPWETLQMRRGDCDDQTILLKALLKNAGYRTQYKVIQTKSATNWNHVYLEVEFPRNSGRWMPLDTTMPEKPMGWEAPPSMVRRHMEYAVSGLEGLSDVYIPGISAPPEYTLTGLDASLWQRMRKAQLPKSIRSSTVGRAVTRAGRTVSHLQLPASVRHSAAGEYITRKSHEWEAAGARLGAKLKGPIATLLARVAIANWPGAFKTASEHQREIIDALPPFARNFMRKMVDNLDDIFSGKKPATALHGLGNLGDIGYFGSELGAFGGLGVFGDLGNPGKSFSELVHEIREKWDHLPQGARRTIIGIIIAALIILICLYIFTTPAGGAAATPPVTSAVGAGAGSAAAGTGGAGIGSSIAGLIPALIAMFRGKQEAAEAAAAAGGEPGTIPGEPKPGFQLGPIHIGGAAALLALLAL